MVPIGFQLQTKAAFAHLPPESADTAVGRNVDDLDELCARDLEAASRCHVFRVAGDPERIELVQTSKRQQERNGACRVVMSAMAGMYTISNVAGVALDVRGGPDAEINGAEFPLMRHAHHAEKVGRDAMEGVNGIIGEAQLEVAMPQIKRADGLDGFVHVRDTGHRMGIPSVE